MNARRFSPERPSIGAGWTAWPWGPAACSDSCSRARTPARARSCSSCSVRSRESFSTRRCRSSLSRCPCRISLGEGPVDAGAAGAAAGRGVAARRALAPPEGVVSGPEANPFRGSPLTRRSPRPATPSRRAPARFVGPGKTTRCTTLPFTPSFLKPLIRPFISTRTAPTKLRPRRRHAAISISGTEGRYRIVLPTRSPPLAQDHPSHAERPSVGGPWPRGSRSDLFAPALKSTDPGPSRAGPPARPGC